MGFLDLFKRSSEKSASPIDPNMLQGLSYVEKERIIVRRISIRDMLQFDQLPYNWNAKLQKQLSPRSHPFAYIDLFGENIDVARSALSILNQQIARDLPLCPACPGDLNIPIRDIVFRPSKDAGYTRLICTPFSVDGRISDTPAYLSFMTDSKNTISSTHGDLFYARDGSIASAEIFFWRNQFSGYFFYYSTVNDKLTLSRVEIPDSHGRRIIVYKGAHILAAEARRRLSKKEYLWIQKNLPDICPKSYSGYMRMKTNNTKNYQKIVAAAATLNYEINRRP